LGSAEIWTATARRRWSMRRHGNTIIQRVRSIVTDGRLSCRGASALVTGGDKTRTECKQVDDDHSGSLVMGIGMDPEQNAARTL
jgi:hypothetical protein